MINSWILENYINKISYKLDKFSKTQVGYNCRCIVCGDSATNPNKKRFHINYSNNNWIVHCFNCGYANTFVKFLKDFFKEEYRELMFESFANEKEIKKHSKDKPKEKVVKDNIQNNTFISAIYSDKCVDYLKLRNVPSDRFDDFIYTADYNDFIKQYDDNSEMPKDERITAKLITTLGLSGFQGRSFDRYAKVRYATFALPNKHIGFGHDRIDKNKDIIVTEGIYDSVVVNNGVAVLNSGLSSINNFFKKEDCILVYDNEIFNKDIMGKLKASIELGYRVFIPELTWKYKDLNDASSFIGKDELTDIIKKNTYSSFNAKIKLLDYMNKAKLFNRK